MRPRCGRSRSAACRSRCPDAGAHSPRRARRIGRADRLREEYSVNSFAGRNPSMLRPLQQVTMIEASNIATVARYTVALRQYIATEDDRAKREGARSAKDSGDLEEMVRAEERRERNGSVST